jgi:hypothetical protein
MTTRSGRLQSLLLATILALGAGVAWALGVVILYETAVGLFPAGREVRENLQFLADGTPVIMNGQVDEDGPILRDLKGMRIKSNRLHFGGGPRLSDRAHLEGRFTPLPWLQRIKIIVGGNREIPDMAWYFIHDGALHGHGYFVRYDPESKLKIGYIGRNGFRRDMPPLDEQFLVDGARMERGETMTPHYPTAAISSWGTPLWTVYLLADDGLFEINLKDRTAKPLYEDPDLFSFTTSLKNPSMLYETRQSASPPEAVILLRKPDQVIELDVTGREIERYTIPAKLRDTAFNWIRLVNGQVLVVQQASHESELFWIDTAGNVLRHENVELHVLQESRRPWPVRIAERAGPCFAVPSLGIIAGVLVWNPWNSDFGPQRSKSLGYSTVLGQALYDSRLVLLSLAALSVLLAVFCYRRQRKFGLPGTWTWIMFVLLFGLPAYFGYLAHRKWPARLPCSSCGKRVPRDRPACFACGHDFPAPAMKGIEVFQRVES